MKLHCGICKKEFESDEPGLCNECKFIQLEGGSNNQMPTFKEIAKEYVPIRTLNIADLDRFDISTPITTESKEDRDGKPYTQYIAVIDEKTYRLANTVFEEMKKLLAVKDDIKFVKVNKQGEGMNTKYTVTVLE